MPVEIIIWQHFNVEVSPLIHVYYYEAGPTSLASRQRVQCRPALLAHLFVVVMVMIVMIMREGR